VTGDPQRIAYLNVLGGIFATSTYFEEPHRPDAVRSCLQVRGVRRGSAERSAGGRGKGVEREGRRGGEDVWGGWRGLPVHDWPA